MNHNLTARQICNFDARCS